MYIFCMSNTLIKKFLNEYNNLINNIKFSEILELKKILLDIKKKKELFIYLVMVEVFQQLIILR